MELAERKCVVLGAGVSGRAAARFLLDRGAVVALYDDAPRAGLAAEVGSIEAAGARILEPGCCLGRDVWDLAVVSPGVPADAPLMRALEDTGTEVIGELELASRFLDAPIVAITGTNGKTTVTELLGRVLGARGSRVFVGGNLGTPLVEAIGRRWDFLVVEVSSFQLETVRTFRPRVAVLLNLTDDHLDRHKDLGAYARVKARIFENQGPGDAAVVNADDPVALDAARGARSTLLSYSTETTLPVGAWVEGGGVVFRLPDGAPRRAAGIELCLPGRFNLGNALAACLAASWVGVDPISAWAEARGFCGRPHRMQMFHEWRGIRFVDDSKATNVGAALAALETVPVPVVWVAGGSKKGGDYGPLAPRLRERARQVILVGAAAREMADACAGAAPLRVASDWPAAVRLAVEVAQPGDTVLLSPACASFDFFTNYAERGDVFQRLCRDETERIDRQAD